MRTSVNLDVDAYDFASAYAHGKGISLGAALSQLVRRAGQFPKLEIRESSRLVRNEHGYLEIAGTGNTVTAAMVKEASEDEVA